MRRRDVAIFLGRCAILGAGLLIWQFGSGTLFSKFWFSTPTAVLEVLRTWLIDGSLWRNLAATLSATGIGYAFGATAGIGAGLLLGLRPRMQRVWSPFITAAYSLPKIALAPLFVILFGIGLTSKIVLVAVTVFFLMLYSTLDGIKDIDYDLVESLHVMGATTAESIRTVIIPGALPWIFTGLRISVRYAFTAAILGELIASNQGVGFLIEYAAGQFNSAGVFAGVLILTVCSVIIAEFLTRTEASTLRWRV